MEKHYSLGTRLRTARNEHDLTQRELARRAGVSANAISLIERDEISPSVATLQNLAAALNIKMSYFFDESQDVSRSIMHIRAKNRSAIHSKGVRIESLGERLRNQELEPFFISLEPHSGSGERPVIHSGHELVFCLQGLVEYVIDYEIYLLEEGDFLLFEAHLPHRWQNPSEEPAEFLLVLQTPHESNEPVQRHFSDHTSVLHLR